MTNREVCELIVENNGNCFGIDCIDCGDCPFDDNEYMCEHEYESAKQWLVDHPEFKPGEMVEVSNNKIGWSACKFICDVEHTFGHIVEYEGKPRGFEFIRRLRRYRDFTPSELVEQIKEEVKINGKIHVILSVIFDVNSTILSTKIVEGDWYCNKLYEREEITFSDGTPFGVEE